MRGGCAVPGKVLRVRPASLFQVRSVRLSAPFSGSNARRIAQDCFIVQHGIIGALFMVSAYGYRRFLFMVSV